MHFSKKKIEENHWNLVNEKHHTTRNFLKELQKTF